MNKLPKHIAIIMDGNGRWAKKRGLPRMVGHKAGGEAAKEIIKACSQRGIEALTLFAFGTENWNRPAEEVDNLMQLFLETLQKNTKDLNKNNIRLRVIGEYAGLNPNLRDKIISVHEGTAANTGLKLNAAINYSGKWDIWQAVEKTLCHARESGHPESQNLVDSRFRGNDGERLCGNDDGQLWEIFQSHLCLSDLPEPDLFIRTSGEQRISNFLLWQLAYTELYFTDILWPDFNEQELEKALLAYAKRERRFGGL